MKIPDFSLLSRNYLDYWNFPHPDGVRKLIGGEANDSDITNTCTIRLCHAMNASGFPIPRIWSRDPETQKPITNRRGKNGKFYIIRVANMRTWMLHQFGKPDIDFKKKPGDPFDRSVIEGPEYEGVIAFEIGFRDATGHFDLWYKNKFSHEQSAGKDYFALASHISLWTTGLRTTLPHA
ncbi:MAG: hypothetical protein JJE04_22235 [Acidobacteriia bacterium]|nr:hypothetical protein [Terriglobia bacterium]